MKVPWQKERSTGGETAVQLRSGGRSTFGRLESYVPLLDGETALYREVREAVPVVDAAICTGTKTASSYYTVKRGDTLWGIANTYGVTLTALLNVNPQIKNPNRIAVGERVTLP